MNSAVALVQAYLRINGYFTVAEYPVLEVGRSGSLRTLTDLDILAFRFPNTGRQLGTSGRQTVDAERHEPDPALAPDGRQADMLVGEVKEGRARLNQAAHDAAVLQAALIRFGCCTPAEAGRIVQELLRAGQPSP